MRIRHIGATIVRNSSRHFRVWNPAIDTLLVYHAYLRALIQDGDEN